MTKRILVVEDTEDNRREGQRGVGLQLLDRRDAVELWHHDVEEHEIGQLVPDDRQRRLAIAGRGDLVALAFEPHLQDVDIIRDIVDDEDQRRLTHSRSKSKTLHRRGRGGSAVDAADQRPLTIRTIPSRICAT